MTLQRVTGLRGHLGPRPFRTSSPPPPPTPNPNPANSALPGDQTLCGASGPPSLSVPPPARMRHCGSSSFPAQDAARWGEGAGRLLQVFGSPGGSEGGWSLSSFPPFSKSPYLELSSLHHTGMKLGGGRGSSEN